MPWHIQFRDSGSSSSGGSDAGDEVPPPLAPAVPDRDPTLTMLRQQPLDETQRRRRPGGGRKKGSVGSRLLRLVAAQVAQVAGPSVQTNVAKAKAAHARQARARQLQNKVKTAQANEQLSVPRGGILSMAHRCSAVSEMVLVAWRQQRRQRRPKVRSTLADAGRTASRIWSPLPRWASLTVEAMILRLGRRQ